MNRAPLLCLALLSLLGGASIARPARADEGARLEARAIAEQGDAQFYAGRCDRAMPLWRQAFAVYHAPTLTLRIARCQALLGQVVAATATLESITDLALEPDAPPAFVAARDDGRRELPGVQARIATLRIAVRPRGSGAPVPVTVEIDGSPAPARAILPIDPGTHHVRVHAESATWEREVHLDDGEARTLDVALWVEPLPTVPRAQRNTALTAFGAGVVALATGVGLSVSALSTARALDSVCGADRMHCPPEAQAAIDRTRAYSLAADGTLTGGALLVVSGAVLLTAHLRFGHESRVRFEAAPRGVILTGEL
jgi:hypothetical protein